MTKYVALLRGIGPGNPNMHPQRLREFFEELGFSNVSSVISSGNVIFESPSTDAKQLEGRIEKELPARLGFNSTTIIRSRTQLQALVAQDPYKSAEHSRQSYLLVTFFKHPPKGLKDNFYGTQGVNALCSVIDTTTAKTPDFMVKAERQFGKEITSRTYKTIQRILQKME
jgi:uncharacterized protein (DUF1697 family)